MSTTPCPRCGHQHDPERCTGHTSAGRPCRNRPIRGGTVCSTHGGSAPQVKAAAEQRQVEAAAEASLTKIWPGLSAERRVTDPLAALEQLAGALQHMVEQVGVKVNGIQNYATGKDMAQVRAEIVLFERLLKTLQATLRDMASLGIAERYVELEKAKVEMVTAALLSALDGAGLEQGVRDVVVAGFLAGLGRGPVVAGEVTR